MIVHAVLILEILSIVICLHCLYGEKFRLEIKTMMLIMVYMLLMESVNIFKVAWVSSLGYLVLGGYCMIRFSGSLKRALLNIVLCIMLITIIQVMCMIIGYPLSWIVGDFVDVFVTLLMFLMVAVVLPRCHLYELTDWIHGRNIWLYLSLGIILMIVGSVLLQGFVSQEIHLKDFILVVPVMLLLLIVLGKWLSGQEKSRSLEKNLCMQREYQDSFQDLLTKVRIRQHDSNNQLMAILGSHYVYSTYEELVKSQEKYCKKLLKDNRYNRLLGVGDNVLAGFLYKKFQEIESDDITVNYQLQMGTFDPAIEVYIIIEMLGILLDNAAEAVDGAQENREIRVYIHEYPDNYSFNVLNRSKYVASREIETWFDISKSSKGVDRGIGLYRIREICEASTCDICCENIEDVGENWLRFSLMVKKKESSV